MTTTPRFFDHINLFLLKDNIRGFELFTQTGLRPTKTLEAKNIFLSSQPYKDGRPYRHIFPDCVVVFANTRFVISIEKVVSDLRWKL
jgi:hypothetical protein